MDHLSEIIKLQDILNSRFGVGFEHLKEFNFIHKLNVVDMYAKSTIGEVVELQEALGPQFYKNWKDREVNLSEIEEEAIDVFTFALCILLALGLDSSEKIAKAYLNKWNKNTVRKDWTINQDGSNL